MQFIDMHCDSLMLSAFQDKESTDLFDSPVTSVDFTRMQRGGQMAQFFAVFVPPVEGYKMFGVEPMEDELYIQTLRNVLLKNVAGHQDMIAMAYNAGDIQRNWAEGKMSAVLTMEDGKAVNGKLDELKRFYDLGFRALSLTWNAHNCFGAPNSADPQIMKEGLTAFGKDAVQYMQELGMLVDVSHLSEGGFYDVAEICQKPFAATHSNCRVLCPHQRNLTDEQLKILGDTGSVTGINFGPEFLNQVTCKKSTALLMAKHARHMADVGGIECVGIGSDFDGIMGELEIRSCAEMELLEQALKSEDFSEADIEKIFYRNVMRVLKDSVK